MDVRRERLDHAMQALAGGDREALATVYKLTSAKLFMTILRIVRSKEQSEDILQDVYIKVWRRAGRFDRAKGSPIAWLSTIARNTALNELRRSHRNRELAEDDLPEVADTSLIPADDWLCDAEDGDALRRCLERLQKDHRRSIILAYFDGYSHSELANKVNVPLGTLKSWIRRGLTGLRNCLHG